MDGLMMVVAVSVTVEALVEYVKVFIKLFSKGCSHSMITQIIAVGIGIAVCFFCNADVYAVVGITFLWPPLGCVLTGIFASRGANYLNDFLSRLKGSPSSTEKK
ncbi:MAG: hypothetical protein ACI39E_06455 [Acutalibacteraceae bacterium]